MGWAPLASNAPLDDPNGGTAAPTGFQPLAADAKLDGEAAAPQPAPAAAQQAPSLPGFSKDQQQAILAYIPKAKDAADLEQFSSDLTGGRAKIGNANDVLDARDKGAKGFAWEAPTAAKEAAQEAPHSDIRTAIGEGIIGSLDTMFPGIGALIRANQGAGKAFTEHAANAAAGDYGPEAGGFLDTVAHPSQYGDFGTNLDRNVAHERAILEGDSQGHGVASALGEVTGAGLVAPLAGSAVDGLAEVPSIAKAAAGGAVYGSGAAGPDHRVAGAVTGAALGAGTDLAAPYVIKAVPAAASAVTEALAAKSAAAPEAIAAARAAGDLGVDLPKYAMSDKDRAAAGALEQTPFGKGPIARARSDMIGSAADARDTIAGNVGNSPETPAQLGDQTVDAAVRSNKARRENIGELYTYAQSASAGTRVSPAQTVDTIDSILSNENNKIGGSKIAPILQSVKADLSRAGSITVQQARDLRTTLREQLTNEAGSTPSNADRITNQVMAGVNADMRNSLPSDAYRTYQQADAAWAQQRSLEDEVLKPFLGNEFNNWGEQVAAKINSDAKGNGTRLARFLSSLPPDAANNVRASIISGLGKSKDGAQNAAGDAFSLNTFLTNYNQLSGARKLIFAPETVQALDKLAKVADFAKSSESSRNFSNTGGVVSRLLLGTEGTATGVGLMTGHPHEAIASALFAGLTALRQYGAAKALANPAFAKRLAATPMNVKAAQAFWNRPWVNAMAAKSPAIAGEIQLFQHAVNDNLDDLIRRAAASGNSQPQGANKGGNGAKSQ